MMSRNLLEKLVVKRERKSYPNKGKKERCKCVKSRAMFSELKVVW